MKSSRLCLQIALLALPALCGDVRSVAADDATANTAAAAITLHGTVLGSDDKPAGDVEVLFRRGRDSFTATTNAAGQFALRIDKAKFRGGFVVARARDQLLQALHQFDWSEEPSESTVTLTLNLEPAKPITIHVVDGQGHAVEAARAGVAAINYWGLEPLDTDATGKATLFIPAKASVHYIYAYKNALGLDYRAYFDRRAYQNMNIKHPEVPSTPIELTLDGAQTLRVRVVDSDEKPIEGVKLYPWLLAKKDQTEELNLSYMAEEFTVATDADGLAAFDWIPGWNTRPITVWPMHTDYVHQRGNYDPAKGDGTLTMKLDRLVPVSGRVTLPDGAPAAGILVRAQGSGFIFDDFRGETRTDGEGRYRIKAAPNMVYLILIDDRKWAAEPRTGFAVRPNKPLDELDFELRPAIRLFGQVTVGTANKPVKEQQISLYQYGIDAHNRDDLKLPNPDDSHNWVQPSYTRWTKTDDDGRYEFFVGPGNYDLRGPQQNEIQKFDLAQETEYEVNFHAERPEKGMLRGLVVTGNPPEPVANAKIAGIYRHQLAPNDLEATTDNLGRFEVERHLHTTVLHAYSSERTLAGIVEIGPDDETITIPVEPPATASGRLIDGATGSPLSGRQITYGIRVPLGDDYAPWRTAFGGGAKTGDDGRFELKSLAVGHEYDVSVMLLDPSTGHSSTIRKVTAENSEHIDFGDLKFKEPVPYKPPTLQERIAKEFHRDEDAGTRFKNVLRDIRLSRQYALVVFADPGAASTEQLFKLRYDDKQIKSALDAFRTLAVPTAGPKAAEAMALAKSIGIELEGRAQPVLCIVDAEGKQLAVNDASDLAIDDTIDANNVLNLLNAHVLTPLDAKELLAEGLALAKKQGKKVLVQESATWCGPCWMLSRFLDKHHTTWEADYVWVKMDHRWTSCREVMDPLRNGAEGGIPWWAILDAEGNVLVTSNDEKGENIGYPSNAAGIAHFEHMLKTTAVHMSADDIAALGAELKKDAD